MDDVRDSLSKLKKGFKRRLRGKKPVPDGVRADAAGEGVTSSASPLQPDVRVTASEEGSGISTDVLQARLRDPSPHLEPMPAHEGRRDSGGKEAGVGEKVLDDVEIAVGSGPSQDVKQTSSPLSVASTPRKQEPDSAWHFLLSCCV